MKFDKIVESILFEKKQSYKQVISEGSFMNHDKVRKIIHKHLKSNFADYGYKEAPNVRNHPIQMTTNDGHLHYIYIFRKNVWDRKTREDNIYPSVSIANKANGKSVGDRIMKIEKGFSDKQVIDTFNKIFVKSQQKVISE